MTTRERPRERPVRGETAPDWATRGVLRLNGLSKVVSDGDIVHPLRIAAFVAENIPMSWWPGRKVTDETNLPPGAGAATVPSSLSAGSPLPEGLPSATDPTSVAADPRSELPCSSEPSPASGAPVQQSPDSGGAGAGTDTPPAWAAELTEANRSLIAEQTRLRELFDSRLRSDDVQNRALDRLLDELRDYKSNFVRQQQQPLLREIIDCFDFATREAERLSALRTEPEETASPAAEAGRSFGVLAQMLVDLLSRYDIEPYRHDGPLFDAKMQQCVKTVPCDSPDRDKQVAEVGASGFRMGDQIIRREQVVVFKYRAG